MGVTSRSFLETEKIAADFLWSLQKNGGEKNCATIVGLRGDLGSGKTAFVQCIAKILGITEHITSPTFVIIKNYTLYAKRYALLTHIDAYRLENGEELKKLGFDELAKDRGNLIFIEWPENVKSIIPPDTIFIDFKFVNETAREITF